MIRTPFALPLTIVLLACPSLHLFGSPPRTDVYGDPLPEGVRLRMGTIQLRHAYAHVTFSADGRTLLSCGQQDGLVRHWGLASGRLVREMHLCKTPGEKKELASVELNGRCAGLALKEAVILRDVESGAELGRLPLRAGQNTHAIPSADGKFLVVKKLAGQDPTTLELWEVARRKKIQSGEYKSGVGAVVFSLDSKRLALTTDQKDLRLWDTATGKEVRADVMGGWAMCFAPDGKTLAVGDWQGCVHLLDAATLKEQALLKSPDVHQQPLNELHYSADGRFLAGISGGGIVVWDVAARTVKHHLPDLRVHTMAFAPDGKTLAFWGWMLGEEIRLWDVAAGKPLHSRPAHANMVNVLAVSPDGKIVASGALHDTYLRLWDAATGRQLGSLKGRDDWIEACVFTPDGKHLVSGGSEGSLQVWDVARAKEARRLGSNAATPSSRSCGISWRANPHWKSANESKRFWPRLVRFLPPLRCGHCEPSACWKRSARAKRDNCCTSFPAARPGRARRATRKQPWNVWTGPTRRVGLATLDPHGPCCSHDCFSVATLAEPYPR
jgi:WD40 repeat protein